MSECGFVEVDGGRIYYEVDGDGRALLLIHGGLGSLRMWDEQVPAVAPRYRVIRYDVRGWGAPRRTTSSSRTGPTRRPCSTT